MMEIRLLKAVRRAAGMNKGADLEVLIQVLPDKLSISGLRSEVNIELNFPPKLRGARSRLYRRRFLQVNTRWKALAEIYTMHSFAPFSNLNFFVKNRQNFFAIELLNIH